MGLSGVSFSLVGVRRIAMLAVAAAVLVQCTPAPPATPKSSVASAAPSTAPPPPPAPTIKSVTAADLGASWRPGCPIDPRDLRRVELDYLGFDGQTHRGALIVNEALVGDVVAIFEQLLKERYPIAKMRTVEIYPGADDELSMEDNNTSAFNCRGIPGTTHWSLHATGSAVDLNPLINPEVEPTGAFQPKNAAPYLDRTRTDPGILHGGDAAVRAFTDRGWRWGGDWRNPIDYQHFER